MGDTGNLYRGRLVDDGEVTPEDTERTQPIMPIDETAGHPAPFDTTSENDAEAGVE